MGWCYICTFYKIYLLFMGMCALQRDIPCYIKYYTVRSWHGANNYRVKVNDLGSDPDCDNCEKPPRIKQPQSMAVNVKLVALDNLKATSIRQSSKPNENRGESVHSISGLFCCLRSTGAVNMILASNAPLNAYRQRQLINSSPDQGSPNCSDVHHSFSIL